MALFPANFPAMRSSRRQFMRGVAGGIAAVCLGRPTRHLLGQTTQAATVPAAPGYLQQYADLWSTHPRDAALQWFKDARFGLKATYGLLSLIGGDEPDLKANPKVLKAHFTAEGFDAGAIADLAVAAHMGYVNFTTRHRGGLHLFRTTLGDSSLDTKARRDLVGELAEACGIRRLGLFLYVPPYIAETRNQWLAHNRTYLRELLTQYGPIAGIWFDGVNYYYKDPARSDKLQELFDVVRTLQPQCLISYKDGALGTEDFIALENGFEPRTKMAGDYRTKHPDKFIEISIPLQEEHEWLYKKDLKHLSAADIWDKFTRVRKKGANFLVNTGLRPDGSIHPDDVKSLTEVGEMIRRQGFPATR